MAVSLDPWVALVEVGWEARLGLKLQFVPGGLPAWAWRSPMTARTPDGSAQVPDEIAASFLVAEGGIETHIWLNPAIGWARRELGSGLPLILDCAWRWRGFGLEPGNPISGFISLFRWSVAPDATVQTPPLARLADLESEEEYDEVLWTGLYPSTPSVFVHIDERRLSLTL